jgi:hypothetical protein
VCVCVRERETKRELVCVFQWREVAYLCVCGVLWVCQRAKERELSSGLVCVCVCERERERK